jgi:ligand-binding sensor domain-containing protein
MGLDFAAEAKFNADKLSLTNVHLKQGLSQCVVTDLAIDKKGFIWASTFDGLNRFDGSNFKIFRNNPDDKSSIISSRISKICTDNNYHVFLRTNKGFSIFDGKSGKTIYQDFVIKHKVSWACCDGKNENYTWMATVNNSLLKVDTRNFSILETHIADIKMQPIHEMIFANEKVYQISTAGEILVFSKKTNLFETVAKGISLRKVQCAGLDNRNNILLSSDEAGLVEINTTTNELSIPMFQNWSTKVIGINRICFNKYANTLLLSSYGQGLFVFDYDNNTMHQFKKNENPLKISANYPIALAANEDGVIFLGFDGMGIDMIDPNIKKFLSIEKYDEKDYETLKFVRKIVEGDDGNIFIGTSGSGLVRFNRRTKKFDFYHMRTNLNEGENFVIEMCKLGNQLWLGYNGGGIEALDIHTMKRLKYINVGVKPNQISNGVIWSMLTDGNSIWVGTRENGIDRVNTIDYSIKHYDAAHYSMFVSNGVRCLNKNKNGDLIIGCEKGLFSLNTKTDEVKLIFPKLDDKNNQPFGYIKSIHFDKKNRTWLGTDGGGVVILNENYEPLKKLNTNNYLLSNVVYSVLPQNDSTYWISSNAGISKIKWNENSLQKEGTFSIENFDESNGLQSNEFNTGAYTRLQDGNLVFGGLNGINIFRGEEIFTNRSIPKVYINEFKIYQNELKQAEDISFTSAVSLKHNENSISISFNPLCYTKPEKIKFMYQLVGHDDNWINSGNRNYISYTNLKSGDFDFRVKASNYDGVWNDEFTSLRIHIATPFYKAWWFITFVAIALFYIAYSIYRYRIKQIKEKESLRLKYTKELAEVEMKALRAQINPHFIFNSLNSINNYILKSDTKMASRYLVKFSQLVRNILNNSSSPYITLQEELQTIELYMLIEGMRFNNQFSYSIETDEDVNTGNISIPSLLLQPYVENAIWHGLLHKDGEKLIKIIVSKLNVDTIKIIIEDNGVGRSKSEEIEQKPKHRKSFGMQLGESRLRLMNQENSNEANVQVIDLANEKKEGIGTQIEIHLPTKKIINHLIHLN